LRGVASRWALCDNVIAMIARALTIAGSDSGGGAGIQADLKTFTVFGVFGMSAVTALTAQNTQGISAIHAVPASFVRQQIEAVLSDIGADAVKTGMLVNTDIVRAVAGALRDHAVQNLVVDPVMVAGTGAALLAPEAREALVRDLLPLATLVTPNVHEAQALTGVAIRSVLDLHRAAAALVARGARACFVKGGHLDGDQAVDVLHDGAQTHELSAPRLPARHAHGTGCQLSAAITANLARGRSLLDSVTQAKQFITAAIAHGLPIGKGTGPANPLAWREK
jgi:hydroxymethylpyrimidine/phosphomethylpyrimidine kinase